MNFYGLREKTPIKTIVKLHELLPLSRDFAGVHL